MAFFGWTVAIIAGVLPDFPTKVQSPWPGACRMETVTNSLASFQICLSLSTIEFFKRFTLASRKMNRVSKRM